MCRDRWDFECGGGVVLDDWGCEAFGFADAFEEEFGDVFDGDVIGGCFAGGAAEHALAEGAAYGENFFSSRRGEGFLYLAEAVVGDALVAGFFFFPELGAAGSAAEGVLTVARELRGGWAEDVEEIAGSIVDAIVPAEVAGVVIGDGRFGGRRREFFVGD